MKADRRQADESTRLLSEDHKVGILGRNSSEDPDHYASANRYNRHAPTETAGPIELLSSGKSSVCTVHHHHVAYAQRWYILLLFSMLAIWSAAAWNTWGPISDTSKVVFNWSDGDVALLTNWSFITMVTSGMFFSWMMDVKGLRLATLTSALLLFIGTGIRALPVGIDNVIWSMNIGMIFVGLSNPILLAGPPLLSSVWFPPHQRTTATAIASQCSYLGIGMSYLVGPQVVHNIYTEHESNISSDYTDDIGSTNESLPPKLRQTYFSQIMELMYIELAICAALLICVFMSFPAKPPTPPSNTAEIQRKDFKQGALILVRKRQFWILGFAYGFSMGIYGAWSTMLDPIFEETLGVKQLTTGWIGVTSNIAGTIGGLLFAGCVDYLGGKMRCLLMFLCGGASLACLWIICLSHRWITFNIESLYAACILYGFLVNATVPIFYEMAVEGMYPVAEGITTMVIVLLNQSSGLVYISIKMIPGVGSQWMNWVAFASVAVCLPLLFIYKERHNRLDVDLLEEEEEFPITDEGQDNKA
ncbi:solute carrier family 49 member 4 homolog isoform X2 [Patiria miniata]|nr:solute carrier family 49 member 4 homolog isoform X2 [Patiria miniata]